MLTLTKIKRELIADHIMPSDLDKKDVRHGLQLKEKMLQEVTDDYIKSIIPNWRELERNFRKRKITDIIDKIICGEISLSDVEKDNNVQCDTWIRYKKFQEGEIKKQIVTNEQGEKVERNCYDFDRDEGYTEWIKQDETNSFNLSKIDDYIFQMKIVIVGDNCDRYYPYQDHTHASGWYYASDDLDVYDVNTFERVPDTDVQNRGKLLKPLDQQEQYCKLFFRNKPGYPVYDWFYEDKEWMDKNYPNKNACTILCDPFRVKYNPKDDSMFGNISVLNGKQWIKKHYKSDMLDVVLFSIKINNVDPDMNKLYEKTKQEGYTSPQIDDVLLPDMVQLYTLTFSRKIDGKLEKPYRNMTFLEEQTMDDEEFDPESGLEIPTGHVLTQWLPKYPSTSSKIKENVDYVAVINRG